MSAVFTVFKKELLDGVRDRRALVSLFLLPLIGPILVSFMLTKTVEQVSGTDPIELPVAGAEHAPALVAFMENHNLDVVEPPADAIGAVRDAEVDAVVIIDADFGERFRAGKPAQLKLVVDRSRTDSAGRVGHVEAVIAAYSKSVGTLRLLAHGTSPSIMEPLAVTAVDLSTPKKKAAIFLSMIPMFVLLASFIGGMYTAMDATAGERERGSLEPLLITPVSRRTLVAGKWLATVTFGSANVLFTLAAVLIALGRVPTQSLGISLSLQPAEMVGVAVAILPLAVFVGSFQLLVASFSRTIKEAQTYLSFMIFLPMIPGMLGTLSPIKTKFWMMLVPVLGQQQILTDLIRGEGLPPAAYLVAAGTSLLLAGVCVVVTGAMFRRESIIYGRSS